MYNTCILLLLYCCITILYTEYAERGGGDKLTIRVPRQAPCIINKIINCVGSYCMISYLLIMYDRLPATLVVSIAVCVCAHSTVRPCIVCHHIHPLLHQTVRHTYSVWDILLVHGAWFNQFVPLLFLYVQYALDKTLFSYQNEDCCCFHLPIMEREHFVRSRFLL